jgi:hypothetical protein
LAASSEGNTNESLQHKWTHVIKNILLIKYWKYGKLM